MSSSLSDAVAGGLPSNIPSPDAVAAAAELAASVLLSPGNMLCLHGSAVYLWLVRPLDRRNGENQLLRDRDDLLDSGPQLAVDGGRYGGYAA